MLSFGFNTDAGHEITAAYMQEQWSKNLGVKSELKGVTFDTFVVDRPKLVYSIARNAWGADYPHPDNFLRALFQSQSGNNDEGYNNPEFDAPRGRGRRGAGLRPSPSRSTTRPRSSSSRTPRRSSPAGASANYEVRPWVKGVIGTGQDSVVIGDLFFENVSIAKH